jgi:peptidoglycan/LPS O-acetylase OafA/YrhL
MLLFLTHAALMASGFLLVFSAMIVAMTQRKKRWWLKSHKAIGLTGGSLLLLGAVVAIAAVASTPAGDHLRTPHTWLGVLTVCAAIITPTLGLLQFRLPQKVGTIRVIHRLFGRLLNLMIPITIFLGLRVAEII